MGDMGCVREFRGGAYGVCLGCVRGFRGVIWGVCEGLRMAYWLP